MIFSNFTTFSYSFSQASVNTTFSFMNGHGVIAISGFLFSINYQLGHNLTSSLQWKTGRDSFMKGILRYSSQKLTISSVIQVCLAFSYILI